MQILHGLMKLQTNNVQSILIKVSFDKYPWLLRIITSLIHSVHTSMFNTTIQKMKQANFWQSVEEIIRINSLIPDEKRKVVEQIFQGMKWIKANEDNFKGVNHDNAMKAAISQANAYFKLINSVCKSNQGLKTNFQFIEAKLDQM